MATQTELSNLLKSLHRAIYAHVDLGRTPGVDVTDKRLTHTESEVDKATKRIFSYFDKMQEKIDVGHRDMNALRGQITHLNTMCHHHAECIKAAQKIGITFRQEVSPGGHISWTVADLPSGVAPAVPAMPSAQPAPFDQKRAQAGEPIEVLTAPGTWSNRDYQGMMIGADGNTYVVHTAFKDGSDYSRPDHVRMKVKPKTELTLYANVARNQGLDGIKGALYATQHSAEFVAKQFVGQHSVVAFPVKVTVTL